MSQRLSEQVQPRGADLHRARWEVALIAAVFAAFALLASFFPRTGDDWAWATQEGAHRLHSFFAGYNGRYAGDLLNVALVSTRVIAALVVSAVVTATLFLVVHLAGNRTPAGYALAGLLYLTMPLGIWRQGVVWLSGFVNYATGALALLLFLALAQAEWQGRPPRPTALRLALVGIVAFVGQLFVEHVTLCLTVLSVGAGCLFRRRRRQLPPYQATWAVGALAGAVVMFTNSAYRNVASGSNGYQSRNASVRNIAARALDYLPANAVVLNSALNAALLVLCLVVGLLSRRRTSTAWVLVGLVAAYGAMAVSLRRRAGGQEVPHGMNALFLAAALVAGAALLVAARLVAQTDPTGASMICVGVVAVVLLSGPLLIVNPVGARCFYPSYIVLLMVVSVLARAAGAVAPIVVRRIATVTLAAAALVVGGMMLVIYVQVSHAVTQRLERVQAAAAAGDSVVTIRPLPHLSFVHDGNPYTPLLAERYKRYHAIASRITIRVRPNPWLKTPADPEPPPAP